MKLWTIQTPDVYEKILKEGKYFCDEKKANLLESDEFRNAYNWLSKKMVQKIGHSKVKYPVWGWYCIDGKNKKPDLRLSGYGERGKELVCLEIEIPDEKVVLSDYDLWHFVLNDIYLFDDDEELDDLEDITKEELQEFLMVPFEHLQVVIPASYDALLTRAYGNYMVCSRESSAHGDTFFDPKKSYTEFLKEYKEGKINLEDYELK